MVMVPPSAWSTVEVGHDKSFPCLGAQCRADVALLQQQLSQMWRLVADFEAWHQSQMDELRRENAELKLQLPNAWHISGDDSCGEQQQLQQMPSVSVSQHRLPPGLEPPGLVLDTTPKEEMELKAAPAPQANIISMSASTVEGTPTSKVQWRIGRISAQLCATMGHALVSPEFDLGGISGMRLMIAPNMQGGSVPKGKRARELHKKMMMEGPLDARLMLKAPNAPNESAEYYAFVGVHRRGPFVNNFSVQCLATHTDLGIDWLQERESDGSLVVCVEMLAPEQCEIVDLCED